VNCILEGGIDEALRGFEGNEDWNKGVVLRSLAIVPACVEDGRVRWYWRVNIGFRGRAGGVGVTIFSY